MLSILVFQYSAFYEDGSNDSDKTSSSQDAATILNKAAAAEAKSTAGNTDEQTLSASLIAQEVLNFAQKDYIQMICNFVTEIVVK